MTCDSGEIQDGEYERCAELASWAFGTPVAYSLEWFKRAGQSQIVVVRRGGRVQAALVEVPMAQWFGQRSVPMQGIAGVAVAPEARRQGLGLELMRTSLQRARARGFALSTLYPATVSFYRKCGYELAGARYRLRADPKLLPRAAGQIEVDELTDQDWPLVRELYAEVARDRTGHLDRGEYAWHRLRHPQGASCRAYGIRSARGLDGYALIAQRGAMPYDLEITDWAARDRSASDRLLTLLADHRTLANSVTWHPTPDEALSFALPERVGTVSVEHPWMLRLVDVAPALTRRGYAPISARVELDVRDAFLPENAGRYVLEVAQGSPHVEHGGSGEIALDVTALAALYSGFASPFELARAGLVHADAANLAQLAALFAGPSPSMPDFF